MEYLHIVCYNRKQVFAPHQKPPQNLIFYLMLELLQNNTVWHLEAEDLETLSLLHGFITSSMFRSFLVAVLQEFLVV